jgi:ABC-type polysaccharide/polyol phosphate export permease
MHWFVQCTVCNGTRRYFVVHGLVPFGIIKAVLMMAQYLKVGTSMNMIYDQAIHQSCKSFATHAPLADGPNEPFICCSIDKLCTKVYIVHLSLIITLGGRQHKLLGVLRVTLRR